MNKPFSLQEVELMTKGRVGFTSTPEVARQLADTMRENEQLQELLSQFIGTVGINTSIKP